MKSGSAIIPSGNLGRLTIVFGEAVKSGIFWFAGDISRPLVRRSGKKPKFLRWSVLISFFLFSACAGLTGRAPSEKERADLFEASQLISVLKEKNTNLKTYKGKGKVTFWKKNKKDLIAGAAWVGSNPNKLRFALRSITGQPLISFSNDGKWLYLLSHTRDQFYKKRSTDFNLKKFTTISIKSIDMVSILAGRIPIYKHKGATVIKDSFGDGYVLVLTKAWGKILEKIYLDENKINVRKVELFSQNGVLAYRVELSEMRNVEGYQIPFRLFFSNGDDVAFQLDINRYWADVSVSPSVFKMAPPD
jgi:outer membrane lipoprotein-sorting protein